MRTTRSSSGPDAALRLSTEPLAQASRQAGKAQPASALDTAQRGGKNPTEIGGSFAPNEGRVAFPVRKAARAVLRVKRGWSVQDALLATGIPRATWYVWLQPSNVYADGDSRSAEALRFAARVRHAFERAQAHCAGNAHETIYSAAKKPVGEVDWRAAHEWSKHQEGVRHRWHEHRELKIEHAGSVSYLEQRKLVSQLPESEIIDLAALEVPEIRDLLPPPAED